MLRWVIVTAIIAAIVISAGVLIITHSPDQSGVTKSYPKSCVRGHTWSSDGTEPCVPCRSCDLDIDIDCTPTKDRVCKDRSPKSCVRGHTWSSDGTEPCVPCRSCDLDIDIDCAPTKDRVCKMCNCDNGGTCMSGSDKCVCPKCFSGEKCETAKDCGDKVCSSRLGTCVDKLEVGDTVHSRNQNKVGCITSTNLATDLYDVCFKIDKNGQCIDSIHWSENDITKIADGSVNMVGSTGADKICTNNYDGNQIPTFTSKQDCETWKTKYDVTAGNCNDNGPYSKNTVWDVQCHSNDDCPGNRTCEFGYCSCSTNSDCKLQTSGTACSYKPETSKITCQELVKRSTHN
jgi:hypothetical protein